MSLTDDIRIRAGEIADLADQIDLLPPPGGGGPLMWPAGLDCLAGTVPSMPSLAIPGESDSGAVNLLYYDRLLDGMPDGAIPFFGHYYGPPTNLQAANTVAGMYNSKIKPWISGKWVIVAPVHADERVGGIPAGYNASCDAVLNGGIFGSTSFDGLTQIFASVSGVTILDPNPSMVDVSGNLAPAYHTDGQHLSKAGNAVLAGLIKAELVALGVGG
jgi:hypothetical protein